MPFEELRTDERLEKPVRPPRDMDSLMLFGCTGFVLASFLTYFLSVWPFFVIPDQETIRGLAIAIAAGFVPAAVLGALLARKFGLPGACGAIGGAMATAIFLHLRVKLLMLGFSLPDVPDPEFPPVMTWIVPLAWLLAMVLVQLLVLYRWPDDNLRAEA